MSGHIALNSATSEATVKLLWGKLQPVPKTVTKLNTMTVTDSWAQRYRRWCEAHTARHVAKQLNGAPLRHVLLHSSLYWPP